MQTHLAPEYQGTPDGQAAEDILRRCVHCGFCTATCPTYQLLGDELDGPRGRIYLIKQVLEGQAPTRSTQLHLDRCLTCRNCETTCPSGVQYGQLVEIGRRVVEAKVERPATERATHWMLREGLSSPAFKVAVKAGQAVRGVLPAVLRDKLPARADAAQQQRANRWPVRNHARRMLMLQGCVQPALMPNINSATARVLDACGIQAVIADNAGCCGAVRAHLHDHEGSLADMRRNIDAWWPLVEGLGEVEPVEAIVFNASACGLTVKDYGRALAHDLEYADKAARISDISRDVSELLPALLPALKARLAGPKASTARPRLAYHPPCTLQHGQRVTGVVEQALNELGFDVRLPAQDAHLCCGAAGTYSVLQPELARQLRDRKVSALEGRNPQVIVSANIGCLQHLQSGTAFAVRHWIEVLDEALAPD